MTLTLRQRLLIGVVKLGMTLLWLVDSLALKHFIISSASTLLIVFAGLTLYNNGAFVGLTSIENGLVYSVYGPITPKSALNSAQVLGANSVKQDNPVFLNKSQISNISAKSFLVVDKKNSKTLAEYNKQTPLAPASTTKLLTVLVALDMYSLDEYISVPSDCLSIETTKLWLPEVEKFKVSELLTGILMSSAGDAACALATGKTSYTEFVQKMNEYATKIGMQNSYFSNPVGLDGYANTHYSTAQDLYLLARTAMTNDFIKKVVSTKEYKFTSADGDFTLNLMNTNKLLWEQPGSVGIKTGTTLEAGEVLIYEYKDDLRDLIIVVMGSTDRFYDTKSLLDWSLENYTWN